MDGVSPRARATANAPERALATFTGDVRLVPELGKDLRAAVNLGQFAHADISSRNWQ
jgi:hypothetical protein